MSVGRLPPHTRSMLVRLVKAQARRRPRQRSHDRPLRHRRRSPPPCPPHQASRNRQSHRRNRRSLHHRHRWRLLVGHRSPRLLQIGLPPAPTGLTRAALPCRPCPRFQNRRSRSREADRANSASLLRPCSNFPIFRCVASSRADRNTRRPRPPQQPASSKLCSSERSPTLACKLVSEVRAKPVPRTRITTPPSRRWSSRERERRRRASSHDVARLTARACSK